MIATSLQSAAGIVRSRRQQGLDMKARDAFTLVEILIVVVILAILAAIVIPQFAPVTTQAGTSRLITDLKTVRSAIEYYKVQHNDTLPGAGGASFTEALTGRTSISGAVGTDCGPYLLQLPVNPFNKLDTVEIEAGTAGLGSGNCGWHFDSLTGLFSADTDEHVDL